MTTMRWFGAGCSARGAPGRRLRIGRRSAPLLLLVVAGLLQTGCQSGFSGPLGMGGDPCGDPCGRRGCGGLCSQMRGLRERLFRPRGTIIGGAPSSGCCGPTIAGEAPIEMGSPAVVTPAPATVVPALPAAPADIPAPSDLRPAPPIEEKLPNAAPGPGPTGSKAPATRSQYEAARPGLRLSRSSGDGVRRAMVATPEPPSGPARGSSSSPAPEVDVILGDLPPLDVPRDDSRNPLPDPAPAAPDSLPSPTTLLGPKDLAVDPTLPGSAEVSVAPGIRRFVALEPKLSGGSLPTPAGLDWLAEKGYRTLLDLREASEVDPAFIEDVASRGLRYVALPIGLKKVDASHVARFNLEISLSDARPLYFCDADGTRPGVLWYVRRLTVDQVDEPAAARQAAELGLVDKAYWAAASAYLQSRKPAVSPEADSRPATPRSSPTGPSPSASTDPAPPAGEARPEETKPEEAAAAPAEKENKVTDIAQIPYDDLANNATTRDSTGWRSYAALVVTGLGVPLAYWSRSAFPSLRTRASLPAPVRRLRSLPPGSGA